MSRFSGSTAIARPTSRRCEIVRFRARERRGVAGIISGVILFFILFTVGTSYFIFVIESNQNYDKALETRASGIQAQLQENLQITTSDSVNGTLALSVENVGGMAANVVSLFVTDPSGTLHQFGVNSTSNTAPALPIPISPGQNTSTIDTKITIVSGNYSVKLLTQRGSAFEALYPPSTSTLASFALSSGAIGDLYIEFDTYTAYTITSHSSTSACPAASSTYSGDCLQTSTGNAVPGFSIPVANFSGKDYAFSITLTNLNPAKADIILDQFSLIYENSFYGNSHQNFIPWYIASVGTASGGLVPVLSKYSPVVLSYDVPTTVYYIAATCVAASSGPSNAGCQSEPSASFDVCATTGNGDCASSGTVSTIFILSNGWKEAPGSYTLATLKFSSANYGQNSPFVSTIYY